MKTLVNLDFHEYDTEQALLLLLEMVKRNEVAGMVFAVKRKRGERPYFGATGQLASNDFEAAGLSGILECQFTVPYCG